MTSNPIVPAGKLAAWQVDQLVGVEMSGRLDNRRRPPMHLQSGKSNVGQSRRLCCLNELKGQVFQLRLGSVTSRNYPVVGLCWNTRISVCSALILPSHLTGCAFQSIDSFLVRVTRFVAATNRLREEQIALQS